MTSDFKNTTAAEIDAALDDPNPNPIANEVSRIMEGYALAFYRQAEKEKCWGRPFNIPRPKTEIEQKSLNLFFELLQQETGANIQITFPNRGKK